MLRKPPSNDAYLTYLVGALNAEFARKEPALVGLVCDDETIRLRFRAAFGVGWVQVHVQSSDTGEGGMMYDPLHYVSSDLVDCREDRLQDRLIPVTGGTGYVIFLIPVQYDGANLKIMYDGQDGRPDNMAIVMPWLADAATWLSGGLETDTGSLLVTDTGKHLVLSGA